jgi:hypothetical protein
MKKISQGDVCAVPFPTALDRKYQSDIAAELDRIRERLQKLLALQATTTNDLAAIMPAVLEKAFAGQLAI